MDIHKLTDEYLSGFRELLDDWDPGFGVGWKPSPGSRSYLVAVDIQEVVGILFGDHDSEIWKSTIEFSHLPMGSKCSFVHLVFTAESKRGQKVGNSLVQEFEREGLEAGNELVMLDPLQDVDRVIRESIFSRMGFHKCRDSESGELMLMAKLMAK